MWIASSEYVAVLFLYCRAAYVQLKSKPYTFAKIYEGTKTMGSKVKMKQIPEAHCMPITSCL